MMVKGYRRNTAALHSEEQASSPRGAGASGRRSLSNKNSGHVISLEIAIRY